MVDTAYQNPARYLESEIRKLNGRRARVIPHSASKESVQPCFIELEDSAHVIYIPNLVWDVNNKPKPASFSLQFEKNPIWLNPDKDSSLLPNYWIKILATRENGWENYFKIDKDIDDDAVFICPSFSEGFDNGFFPKNSLIIKKAKLLLQISQSDKVINRAQVAADHKKELLKKLKELELEIN